MPSPSATLPACNRRIGANLAAWRQNRRLSQLQIASILGLPREVVSRIETGTRPLRLSEAILLAERLGLSLDTLADGTPVGF